MLCNAALCVYRHDILKFILYIYIYPDANIIKFLRYSITEIRKQITINDQNNSQKAVLNFIS